MSLKPDRRNMQAAIREAEINHAPLGAALTMGDEVFMVAAGQIQQADDPAARVVKEVIQKLTGQLQKSDLSGFTLYVTCEPGPICLDLVNSYGIGTVVYGCNISDVPGYSGQPGKKSEKFASKRTGSIRLFSGFMTAKCEDLLQEYL